MNYAIVFRLLGYILLCEAVLLLLPAGVCVIYGEMTTLAAFLITAVLCAVLGYALKSIRPSSNIFYMREGFVTTALSWVLISVMGALPFIFSGTITDPVAALFETVSGFTTTGASILPAVEGLPYGILFWRSFTHWIGGMGVLVFLLSLLPLTGGSHVNLMKAESPGPQVEKLVPKVQSTAKILYGIYLALTILEAVLLLAGGMPLFDAVTTSFGTAGTGGFGIKNDSIGSYSTYLQVVITVFMILFGVNFNVYFLLLMRKFKRAFASEEVRWYFIVIFAAIALISWDIRALYGSVGTAVQQAAFQVGSIITTTGFSTCNFDAWPVVSRTVLVLLMFIGACAGSTGGGIKVSRLVMLTKTIIKEMKQALHPQIVTPVRIDGKPVGQEVLRATHVFLIAYMLLFSLSTLLVGFDGFDLVTNFTAVAATLNNIGPGLALVGPMENFGLFSSPAKLVLIFDMLAGRLEVFPMLILFLPDTWKKF
jgi:trk system potassium uptake protein TrkH